LLALLALPSLNDTAMTEYRFLDPPADTAPLGVTGDWVIRTAVDCAEPVVPAASLWGHGVVALLVLGTGALMVRSRSLA